MEWNEVKAKPKKVRKPKHDDDDDGGHFGGVTGNKLYAGAVRQTGGGPAKVATSHQASAIADFDPLARDDNEEIKFEKISLECGKAVQSARLQKEMTQGQLAKLINEKAGLIHDIEQGEAPY